MTSLLDIRGGGRPPVVIVKNTEFCGEQTCLQAVHNMRLYRFRCVRLAQLLAKYRRVFYVGRTKKLR